MARTRRAFPGMGAHVVILRYGDAWVAHAGAATLDGARKHRRALPQWRDADVRIVANVDHTHDRRRRDVIGCPACDVLAGRMV